MIWIEFIEQYSETILPSSHIYELCYHKLINRKKNLAIKVESNGYMVNKKIGAGAQGLGDPAPSILLARAMVLEEWAMSLEPWTTINNNK